MLTVSLDFKEPGTSPTVTYSGTKRQLLVFFTDSLFLKGLNFVEMWYMLNTFALHKHKTVRCKKIGSINNNQI